MTKTKRKARKEYKCDYCESIIKKGEIYILFESKEPKYKLVDNWDEPEEQIGIEYYRAHLHIKCPHNKTLNLT